MREAGLVVLDISGSPSRESSRGSEPQQSHFSDAGDPPVPFAQPGRAQVSGKDLGSSGKDGTLFLLSEGSVLVLLFSALSNA